MTYDKALDVLRIYINYLNGNIPMYEAPSRHKLHQVLQALEKFEGAVAVVYIDSIDPNDGCPYAFLNKDKEVTRLESYKLYAVPKE